MKDKRPLIVDYIPFTITPELIRESLEKNSGKLIVSGILQSADKLNQNGRVYKYNILDRELNKYKKLIAERRSLGELDHPNSEIINLQNVSHLVTAANWNGKDIVGKIEILNTPNGNILRNLLEAQVKLGISSRGLGSLTEAENNTHVVGDDFELVSWEFVSNPSTINAFMSPLTEGKLTKEINDKIVCRGKVDCLIYQILQDLNT